MKSLIKAALLLSAIAVTAQAQLVERKTLSIDGAHKVIAGAVAYAKKVNAPGAVIAVVDEGGNLMALERLDGTFAAGANISIGKARTAVLFKRPTKAFEDIIKNGRTAMVALPDTYFTPLQGESRSRSTVRLSAESASVVLQARSRMKSSRSRVRAC